MKMRRVGANMTRADLAAALGISIGYVGELERGEKKIDDRLAGAVLHATAPVQFWGEARLPVELEARARAVLIEAAAYSPDRENVEVAGLVMAPKGVLMFALRRKRGEKKGGSR
jgi:transcriptional regulator with XRE-family HTH domain